MTVTPSQARNAVRFVGGSLPLVLAMRPATAAILLERGIYPMRSIAAYLRALPPKYRSRGAI